MFSVKQSSLFINGSVYTRGCIQIALCSNASQITGLQTSAGSGAYVQKNKIYEKTVGKESKH